MPPELIITPELARELAELSTEIGRQLGVLIARSGRIEFVLVGDRKQIMIPALPVSRSAGSRLKGLRYVHTHLSGERSGGTIGTCSHYAHGLDWSRCGSSRGGNGHPVELGRSLGGTT